MKRSASLIARALAGSGMLTLLESLDRRTDRLRVLTFHRVDETDAEPDLDPGLLSATPREFEQQLALLCRHFSPVSLDQVQAAMQGEAALPPRAVLLTFDDAYEDFAHTAWPLLQRYRVPAVLFVPTAFVGHDGGGFWWDRLHALLRRTTSDTVTLPGRGPIPLTDAASRRAAHKAIRTFMKSQPHAAAMRWFEEVIEPLAVIPSVHRVLDWPALKALAEQGVAVCSHGHQHALCTRLPQRELRADLCQAQTLLREAIPASVSTVMAYPANAWDDAATAVVAECDYELAFAGDRGVAAVPAKNPLAIERIPVLRHHLALFRAQLHPVVSGLARRVTARRASSAENMTMARVAS